MVSVVKSGPSCKHKGLGNVEAIMVALLCCCVILAIRPIQLPKFTVVRDPDVRLGNDAKAGSVVSLPRHDASGRLIPATGLWVVAVGSCAGCSLQTFSFDSLRDPALPLVILIEGAPSKEIPERFRQLGPNKYVVWDPDGKTHTCLNAFFLPRYYLLDQNRSLVRSSAREGDIPVELRR
jgi:hypothetical protein